MRPEISFLAIAHSPQTESTLRSILDEFEQVNRVKVNLEMETWDTAWKNLVKYALYHGGPDICEMPSTWVSDLMAMNALRRFTPTEIYSIGGQSAFLEPAWKSCVSTDGEFIWAVPWIIDTRVLYYRKDLLSQAGVQVEDAFTSPHKMESTLYQLQESGVRIPWVTQTIHPNVNTLHNLATWVWNAGGDFVDPQNKQILFTQPEALAGMRAFFGLHRFIVPEVSSMAYSEAEESFWRGDAAVVMAGPNFVVDSNPNMAPIVRENFAAVLPPGIPFIGGSHISVWNHTRQPRECVELVQFLVSPGVQRRLNSTTLLPARLDAYQEPGIGDNPMIVVLLEGLKRGRSYPFFSMWGMLEDRLVPALSNIWRDVITDRGADLNLLLTRHLEPLARRLNLTFKS